MVADLVTDQKIGRERILEGASALLDSGHCGDLIVQALARFLRMSKSTLYKFFEGKEEVLIALVTDACDRADAELFELLDGRSASALLTELAFLLGRHAQRLPRAILLEPEHLPEACTARLQRTLDAFTLATATVVHRGIEADEFQGNEPRLIAVSFVAAVQSLLVDGARQGLSDYSDRAALVPPMLLHGLVRR